MPIDRQHVGRFVLLVVTWLGGAVAATAAFTVTTRLMDGKSLRALPSASQWTTVSGSVALVMMLTGGALATTGLLCALARRRGHRRYRYGSAVVLGFCGYMLFWLLPSIGLAGAASDGTVEGVVSLWLFGGAMGALINGFSLLVTVPFVIRVWYRILNGPAAPPAHAPGSAVKRRALLVAAAGVFVAGLVALDARNARKERPITAVRFDLGQDVDDTLDQSGIGEFHSETEGGWTAYHPRDFAIPSDAPVTYTRAGYEIGWTGVFQIWLYAPEKADKPCVERVHLKHGPLFARHRDAILAQVAQIVDGTLAQFRQGRWQRAAPAGVALRSGRDSLLDAHGALAAVAPAVDPAYTLTADDWRALAHAHSTLAWRWSGDGVNAMLRVIASRPDPSDDTWPDYDVLLDFELQRT